MKVGQNALAKHTNLVTKDFFRDPSPQWDPRAPHKLPIPFPFSSRDFYGSGIGVVWVAGRPTIGGSLEFPLISDLRPVLSGN